MNHRHNVINHPKNYIMIVSNFLNGLKSVEACLPKHQVEALRQPMDLDDLKRTILFFHNQGEGSSELDWLYGLLHPITVTTLVDLKFRK